ncbi:MAG: polysulfide reductase NrfD [Myxococcales bacterium]|nr:polysulfide reductase NrfD [Myxococcales bacterium]MCB9521752.1 polysulfide reductase NrfD [Myxococcales bacterium]
MKPELIEVVSNRTNPGIDPVVHVWGWEVPVYLFLGGLAAGIMVVLSAMELRSGERPTSRGTRWAPLAAVALVSLGMGALFLDLAHKLHVWRFYTTFQPTSPMSWGAWILMLVYPVLLLQGLSNLNGRERTWLSERLGPLGGLVGRVSAWADEQRRPVLWTTAATGVGLGIYTGLLLGTLSARFQWNSAVMGPLFLASGVSTGAALLLLLRPDAKEHAVLVRWDTAAIAIELVLLAVMILGFLTGDQADLVAANQLLGGAFTPYFWGLVVLTGLAAPLAMNLAEFKRRMPATALGPVLVLIGGFSLRTILVAAGQVTGYGLLP